MEIVTLESWTVSQMAKMDCRHLCWSSGTGLVSDPGSQELSGDSWPVLDGDQGARTLAFSLFT